MLWTVQKYELLRLFGVTGKLGNDVPVVFYDRAMSWQPPLLQLQQFNNHGRKLLFLVRKKKTKKLEFQSFF